MKVAVQQVEALGEADDPDLIIDGIIGYSLKGAPYGSAKELIRWVNAQDAPVLSLDAPSGVDATKGTIFDPAVRATATLTLALPKEGLRAEGVDALVGELYVADISVPPQLYGGPALNLDVGSLFARDDIVRLEGPRLRELGAHRDW
jgi:NAD(P)H-hydrate epimerase